MAPGVQAELIAAAKGVQLPKDFLAAAMAGGLRQGALQQYLNLQVRALGPPTSGRLKPGPAPTCAPARFDRRV